MIYNTIFRKKQKYKYPLEKYQRKIFGEVDKNKPICYMSMDTLDIKAMFNRQEVLNRISEKFNIIIVASITLNDTTHFAKLIHKINVIDENNIKGIKRVITYYPDEFYSFDMESDNGMSYFYKKVEDEEN